MKSEQTAFIPKQGWQGGNSVKKRYSEVCVITITDIWLYNRYMDR